MALMVRMFVRSELRNTSGTHSDCDTGKPSSCGSSSAEAETFLAPKLVQTLRLLACESKVKLRKRDEAAAFAAKKVLSAMTTTTQHTILIESRSCLTHLANIAAAATVNTVASAFSVTQHTDLVTRLLDQSQARHRRQVSLARGAKRCVESSAS